MAENAQERTERPTAKRLEEARKRGQLPRSQELNAAAVVLIAGGALHFLGASVGAGLYKLMQAGLSLTRDQALDESSAISMFSASAGHALLACAPVLGLTLVAALLAPLAIGGWNLSFGVLAPDFSRLSPAAGFERIFSTRGLVELTKAFAKFGVVALVAILFLRWKANELLGLGGEPIAAGIGHAVTLSGQALLGLAGALGAIAAIDVPFQIWQHSQRLRMTREEIREEMKESDGSPEIKGRIRAVQQAMARRRMMHDVPKADVVVVNPTHFAVALRYDEKRMRAPVVLAKGVNEVAARIREVATEHRVPIFEAPPLARALHRSVDIGGEVPASLYVAVAQVLTYVYQLRTAQRDGRAPPAPPPIDLAVAATVDPTADPLSDPADGRDDHG
jgi:flagellar biosynthetic protein FlhB